MKKFETANKFSLNTINRLEKEGYQKYYEGAITIVYMKEEDKK